MPLAQHRAGPDIHRMVVDRERTEEQETPYIRDGERATDLVPSRGGNQSMFFSGNSDTWGLTLSQCFANE